MTTITPTYTTANWLVDIDEPLVGLTQIGETTGVQIGLPVVVGEGENDFLDALNDSAYTPPALPDSGWLEQGEPYTWQSQIVLVRQSHQRTIFPPDQTPALFLFWQPEGDGVADWIANEQVHVGTLRRYDDVVYRARQAHVTQADWTPPTVPALWEVAPDPGPGVPDWQPGVYALDAAVAHNGITWQSRRNNNSWEPGTNDSGWLQIEPLPGNWYYLGSEGYPLNWEVTHNGQLWRNQQANNFWEPGVFGWVVV